jgi:prolyl oligopeptidase
VAAGKAQWKRVVANEDAVTGMAYMDDTLYLQTHQGASRFLVKRLDLKAPDFAKAPVVVPASQRVITGIAAAKDALYVEARDGNVKRLAKLAYTPGAKPVDVKLPLDGSLPAQRAGVQRERRRPAPARASCSNWRAGRGRARSTRSPADGSVRNTGPAAGGRRTMPPADSRGHRGAGKEPRRRDGADVGHPTARA